MRDVKEFLRERRCVSGSSWVTCRDSQIDPHCRVGGSRNQLQRPAELAGHSCAEGHARPLSDLNLPLATYGRASDGVFDGTAGHDDLGSDVREGRVACVGARLPCA